MIDLFNYNQLNGVYYETITQLYVSYVQGRRHYIFNLEEAGCTKEWQAKIKRDRSI